MAKRIDITDKLDFEEKPIIVIKGEEIKVNDEATTILQASQLMENFTSDNIIKVYELLFDKSEREKIDKMKLSFRDFSKTIAEAAKLIAGDDMGEILTPATT